MDKKSILQWNCRGLKANFNELLILTTLFSPNVICLQETFLKTTDNISFKDYSMYNHIITDNQKASGGTSILVKSNVPHRKIDINTNLQAVAVNVTLSKTITICSIYLPPHYNFSKQELENLINQLPRPYILLGDFNSHSKLWGCTDTNNKGEIIENFIAENDLCLFNDKQPTYLHSPTRKYFALDLSICSPNIYLDYDWSVVDDLHGSDHFPIVIEEIESTHEDRHPRWNLSKANWENFNQLCNEKLKPEVFKTANDIQSFTDELIHIAEKCIPKSSTRSKRNRPWFNDAVKNSINKRKSALRKFNRQPTKENLIHAKHMRAKARKTIKSAKKTSWQQYVSKLNSRTPAKKIWDMIRKISGKNKSNKHVHINSNGNICSTAKDISNALGESFQKNSSSSNYSETFQDIKQEQEKNNLNFSSLNREKYNLPFTTKELLNALHKSHDTAVGPDDIHYQILKHLPNKALETLLNILNDIWITGKFPDDWRKATIIPIPKPNKDHTNATNYRPIALTSCLCKTMERMINDRLVWFLESNQLITKFQAGFRKNNSTNDHLIRLESFIRDAFIKKEHVVAVFFDLEKAYDTTWKYGIMKDLHTLGLKGRLPLFIQNFLSSRSFNVRIGSTLSDMFEQEQGVPQGSILSPTLFSIKINNIVKCVKDPDCSLFVDDFGIFYRSKNMETIEFKLQRSLNNIEDWATENGFKFSKTKTQCVHFCQIRKLHLDPNLTIYGSQIPVVTEAKFLGLLFDNKLSFIPHIKALKAKCLKALDILKVLSSSDWGGDCTVLLNLYRSLIRSKLDYGSIVYGSARKSYLKSLDTIHHQGLRLALGAFRTSPVASLYAESNEPSLYIRREKLSLQYVTKLAANPRNSAYDSVFYPKFERFYSNQPSAIKPLGLRIKPLLEEANINEKNIQPFALPSKEPWTLNPPKIILDLHKNKKSEVESHIFKNEFLEIKSNFKHHISIYTDGSKQDEKVACSVISPNFTDSIRLPDNSSIFTAEAKAIDIALYHIRDQSEKQFIIYSDSLSVLKSLRDPQHRNPLIQQILRKYHYLSVSKEIIFCWLPSHMNIRGNELADLEAKSALSLIITNLKIPFSDFKSNINKYISNKCQSTWEKETTNKLNEIKQNFNSKCIFSNYSRKDQTRITRCRIGHTRLTHSFILKNEQAPFCVSCNEPFTVKHFLIYCTEFNHIRPKYFNVTNIKELFTNIPSYQLINYLKEIGLFNKL
ncbi:MAG: reverse transcriptase domain-containing protein [Candidatus Thiodiazotropha endolucinida]|nr:endonuclease/exonuclease/phosphatase family protein [Candidatus Thiodiazotropha taylori]MCG8117736.1 endonuclease/exonuclease/phosphatase family protein [Candidatus Thiodiazotropha taylori]MCW4262203.1 reverse transcriptase domain-containing protein [Candidatus Thiodiazotropha endolucinida]MCW4302032.1 reverse transcriptase domain-containing protein [Candidatus Thiodiazotropha endolucinida]